MELEQGITIEEIYRSYEKDLPYTIIAAKVDNKFEDLTYALDTECRVELLDIRTQAANLIYQYSLSLIYLKVFNLLPCGSTAILLRLLYHTRLLCKSKNTKRGISPSLIC